VNLRRLRREWRRLSPLQQLGLIAAALVAFVGLGHEANPAAGQPSPVSVTSVSGNVAIGQQLAAADGWTGQQWDCLHSLWMQESSWSNTADNAQSGAYGIPQALPATKMPAAALPPQNSAASQIRWGLGYVASRYGTPCVAWEHEEENGWY